MTRIAFSLQSRPDPRFAALVWEVFFDERGRGLSLAQHFPWLGQDANTRYASLMDGDELVAGLVAKAVPGTTVAAIGLVCVRADRRGQGLSRLLLDHSLQALDALGFSVLTLWTGKPDVYRRQQFDIEDDGLLLSVEGWQQATRPAPDALPWPAVDDPRGLPPYALSAQRLRSGDAEAIVLTDPRGIAVAEWRGTDEAVADLLATCMPAQWRLHAVAGDTLPAALAARGARLHAQPNNLQMWRERPGQAREARPVLRVLDRI